LLLVEDNEVNAHLVLSFLKRRGFEIDVAEDGEKAIEIARKNIYDLILMDIHLPQKDGLETAQDLRAGRGGAANAKVPIVALTASAIKGERERCLKAGMNEFLTKPVDLDLLEQTIRSHVGVGPSRPSVEVRRAPDLDDDLRGELLVIFQKVTPPRMAQIREAVAKGDWKAAAKVAHTMKSSAAQLGFFELSDVCTRLEAKGFAGNGDGWDADIVELEAASNAAVTGESTNS
jgi:CheY-like chemotaxis protein/HPt (histidine-containing phosphotransfer) domain-containing protein